MNNTSSSDEKMFGRTKSLLDPAEVEDLERKRRANMTHKREIEAQIEEKRRRKQLEDELVELDNRKAENEAREQMAHREQSNDSKRTQPHYRNLERMFNEPSGGGADDRASVLQGESSRFEKETQTVRSNITDTRANEVYKAIRAAELAAAEEKHKRLLKRLQRGGHDTRQLERKFAELKARLTGQPLPQSTLDYETDMLNTRQPLTINGPYYEHDSNEEKKRQQQKATLNRIFQMIRENTENAFPAELNEQNLEQLITNQMDSRPPPPPASSKREPDRQKKQQQKQEQKQGEQQQQTKRALNGEKPIWNYQNMEGRRALPNSMKDPFYAERAKFIEERRRKRLEYFQSRHSKGSTSRGNNNISQQSQRSVDTEAATTTTTATMKRRQPDPNENSINQQKESLMKLLTTNLASNPIYEEDEDLYINNRNAGTEQDKNAGATNLNKSNSSSIEDMLASNRGYVPFLRTNEILDPVHAGSPVPPSREPSAVKKSREKARQAYFQNMKPADYGSYYQPTYEEHRNKDPLLNNSLVRNNPTPRQEQILSQLASLKQSLIKKQKEIATSISHDQFNFDDYDKQID